MRSPTVRAYKSTRSLGLLMDLLKSVPPMKRQGEKFQEELLLIHTPKSYPKFTL